MTAPTTWESRIVGHGEVAPDALLANPANWRAHPIAQREALGGVLDQVGWVQQVIVNRRLVDGHARVEEALRRGEPSVPVLYVELEPAEEALVLAALDPMSAMAERDPVKLADLLAGIAVDEAGLADLQALPPTSRPSRPRL